MVGEVKGKTVKIAIRKIETRGCRRERAVKKQRDQERDSRNKVKFVFCLGLLPLPPARKVGKLFAGATFGGGGQDRASTRHNFLMIFPDLTQSGTTSRGERGKRSKFATGFLFRERNVWTVALSPPHFKVACRASGLGRASRI